MSKKNPYSKQEREINNLARRFEHSRETGDNIFMDAEDMADLADWYFSNHQEDMAWDVMSLGLSIHGNNTVLLVEKANLLLDMDRLPEAEEVAELISDPEDSEVIVLQAKIMIRQGLLDDAKEMLEEKENLVDIAGVALMLLEEGQAEEAMKWLRKEDMEEEDDESYLAALGDCYQALGEYEKSIAVINKLLDIDPYSASYWHGLALCYFHLEKFQEALEAADYAIISDEEYGPGYTQRGDIYQVMGNRKKALEDYRKAVELKALQKDYLDIISMEDMIANGQWGEALEILKRDAEDTSRSDEYRSESAVHSAYCLIKLDEDKEAEKWIKKALKLAKNNVTAYILQGRLHLKHLDEKKAVESWKKALKLEPYDTTWERIAGHCLSLQRFDYVEVCYECVKDIRPNDKYVNLMLAMVNLVMGNEKKFKQYNSTCEHPLSDQKIKEFKNMLKHNDRETFVEAMYKILRENNSSDPFLNQ